MKKTMIIFTVSCALLFISKVNAQSPTIKWGYDINDASFGQSVAGDIDKDGKFEVVFGCYRNDSCIYALNADNGTLLWKFNAHSPGAEGCNDVAPIIYDVDNDDSLEVVFPGSCNPTTFCLNGATGAIKWQVGTHGSDSPPTIADIDNDGKPEILHGEFGGYVICINAENGSVAWEIPVDLNSWIQTAPTIVDLDGNGQLDFVVGTWNNVTIADNKLYAYKGDDHSLLWSYPIRDFMYHGTAVADLDQDGKPELVIGSYNDTLYCINGENGSTNWKYAATGGYIGGPATIADLDNDGACEVLFISSYVVTALSGEGIHKWHYNIPNYEQSFRGCALADINNDAFLDITFGTDGGKVIALTGNTGSLIWTKDLAAHYGNANFALDHAPLLSDFDNDDSLEVFIVGGHGEYPAFQNDFGRAYMITAGKGNGPDWLIFQHDIRRQSSLCTDSSCFVEELNPNKNMPVKFFPNPTNNTATILFPNPKNEKYFLAIYNTNGLLMRKIENITAEEILINNINWSSGLYFYKLQNDFGTTIQGKFIVE